MITISIGKYRGLQQCSTLNGAIAVLALDHRNNLRSMLNPGAPEKVSAEHLTVFKTEAITTLAPAATAVLLDPEFGIAQCIAAGALPGHVGLLTAIEATGYTGDPAARQSRLLSGWSIAKSRRMGASAVKLLVYYHPDSPTAPDIETFLRQVVDDCAAQDIPLFLEPLSYSLDPARKQLLPAERHRVVLETARRLTIPGVDVLKAEFPLDIKAEPDERAWAGACAQLSQASRAPWVLLSASVDFETYLRMVAVACRNGASGVAVGRAVWQEATGMDAEARRTFFEQVAHPRMERLTALCAALAKPWTAFYTPVSVGSDWYKTY